MIWKSGISYSIKLFFSSLLTESDTVYSTRNFVCFWIFYVSLSPFFRPLFIISYFPFRKSALNFLHCTLNLFCNELCLPCYSLCDSEGEKIYIFSSAETPFLPFIPFCTEKKNQLCISPSNFIRSHTNIKIQCEAPCGFPESFYVLHTYRTYFTVFEKFECIFFFLFVLVSADRKVINHTGDSDLLVNPFMQTK